LFRSVKKGGREKGLNQVWRKDSKKKIRLEGTWILRGGGEEIEGEGGGPG